MSTNRPKMVVISGISATGKTTLLRKLVSENIVNEKHIFDSDTVEAIENVFGKEGFSNNKEYTTESLANDAIFGIVHSITRADDFAYGHIQMIIDRYNSFTDFYTQTGGEVTPIVVRSFIDNLYYLDCKLRNNFKIVKTANFLRGIERIGRVTHFMRTIVNYTTVIILDPYFEPPLSEKGEYRIYGNRSERVLETEILSKFYEAAGFQVEILKDTEALEKIKSIINS